MISRGGNMSEYNAMINRLIDLLPILAILGGFTKWILNLKTEVRDNKKDIKNLQEQIKDMDSKHLRLDERLEKHLTDMNHRIDNCKNAILENLKLVLNALNKH
jgi:predicted RNase H-like nuclease (RuvC/YqgF family)